MSQNGIENGVKIKKNRFLLRWTKFDLFAVIPTLVIAIICSIFVFFLPNDIDDFSKVTVYQDGSKVASVNLLPKDNESTTRYIILFKEEKSSKWDDTYPTNENYKIEKLSYLYGDMVIRIQDGVVKIVEETCPKHYCSMGEISRPGQTLVCAPNNVYITIINEGKVVEDPGIII